MVEKAELSAHPADWWSQFYGPLRQFGHRVAEYFAPNAEASASADTYEVSVELPGVAESDIHIELQDGRLLVTGEKHAEREEKDKNYYFSERTYGRFQRSFTLPRDADPDKVVAAYKQGVLSIRIAKRQPQAPAARKIDIQRG